MFTYMIHGALLGTSEGLMFHSCVPELQRHPGLWADECPFRIPSRARAHIELLSYSQQAKGARAASVPHAV